jgi:transposase-like protein
MDYKLSTMNYQRKANTMSTTTNTIEIKPYNLTELSRIYGVTTRTIKKWITPFEKEMGMKNGRYYNAKQVKILFDKLGLPGVAGD